MDNLISPTQTSYIKGRNIMDNVVVATEVLYFIKRKKKLNVYYSK
jgi:hypothetical protein